MWYTRGNHTVLVNKNTLTERRRRKFWGQTSQNTISGLFTRYDPPPFESKSQQNKGGVISSSILILRIRMILRAPQARKFARICSFLKQNPLRKRYIPLKFSRLRRAHQLRHRTKSQMYNSFSRSEIWKQGGVISKGGGVISSEQAWCVISLPTQLLQNQVLQVCVGVVTRAFTEHNWEWFGEHSFFYNYTVESAIRVLKISNLQCNL